MCDGCVECGCELVGVECCCGCDELVYVVCVVGCE